MILLPGAGVAGNLRFIPGGQNGHSEEWPE